MAAERETIFPAMPANTFLRRIDVDDCVAGKPEAETPMAESPA